MNFLLTKRETRFKIFETSSAGAGATQNQRTKTQTSIWVYMTAAEENANVSWMSNESVVATNESVRTMQVSNVTGTEREQRQESVSDIINVDDYDKRSLAASSIMNLYYEFGKDAANGIMDMTYEVGARSGEVASNVGEAVAGILKSPISKDTYHSQMLECKGQVFNCAKETTSIQSTLTPNQENEVYVYEEHEAQTFEIIGVETPKIKNICSVKPFGPSRPTRSFLVGKRRSSRNVETSVRKEMPPLQVRGTLIEI